MKNDKAVRIAIKGAYGESNFGDDLLMLVFEKYFLSWDILNELQFVGIKSDYLQNLLSEGTLYGSDINECDWLVYGGGTQFFAFDNVRKSTIDKFKDIFLNPKILITILKNKLNLQTNSSNRVAFLGIGLGPFSNNQTKIEQTKNVLNTSDFVGVRDEISFDYTQQWGVNAVEGADVVFSSFFDWDLPIPNQKSEKKNIAIIVRDWNWTEEGKSYYDKLIDFTNKNKQISFTFVLFSAYLDKEWQRKLKDNSNVLVWNPKNDTVQAFIDKLSHFDSFISARYHGAILGVLLNKPVICIEIEPKLRILKEQVPQLKLWKQPFDLKDLQVLLGEIEQDVNYSESILDLRSKADKMLDAFKKHFYEKS